jgi:tellurite resistance protein TehA-like permease
VQNSFGEYNRGTLLTAQAASPIAAVSEFVGLLAWGFGTFWWLLAILSIVYTLYLQSDGLKGMSFSMSAWAIIFPWVCFSI